MLKNYRPYLATLLLSIHAILVANPALAKKKLVVEKCDKPMGTIAISEPQEQLMLQLQIAGLPSPTSLLRLYIEESNCFQIVERGVAFQNLEQERALAEGREVQRGSNFGKGQLVAADFVLRSDLVSSGSSSIGGGLGGVVPVVGGLFGGVKKRKAQTSIRIIDARSGIQVVSASGSAKKSSFSLGGAGIAGAGGGALGGYASTSQGKVIAKSYLRTWNEIVGKIRNQPSLLEATSAAAQENAAASFTANGFNPGEVLTPKIAGVPLLSAPDDASETIASLSKEDEAVVEEEQNGYVKVLTVHGSGWVRKLLVKLTP